MSIIIWAVIIFFLILMIYKLVQSNKPWLSDTYYEDFKSLSELELKYSKSGTCNTGI